VAADLVRMGWTASDRILESPTGFFHAAGGGFDAGAIHLGRPWTFSSPGVSIKPFPSGSLSHPAMSD
jgi:2-methylcitrate dehydratase PrpD